VIDIGITGKEDNVEPVYAEVFGVLLRHREERGLGCHAQVISV
jgi:hypothetical protein